MTYDADGYKIGWTEDTDGEGNPLTPVSAENLHEISMVILRDLVYFGDHFDEIMDSTGLIEEAIESEPAMAYMIHSYDVMEGLSDHHLTYFIEASEGWKHLNALPYHKARAMFDIITSTNSKIETLATSSTGMSNLLGYVRLATLLFLHDDFMDEFWGYTTAKNEIFDEGYSTGSGSQSVGEDHLYLQAEDGDPAERTYVTNSRLDLANIIDFSYINSLKIDWENTGQDHENNISVLAISKNKDGQFDDYEERIIREKDFSRTTDSISVDGLTGTYYVRVHARDNDDFTTQESEITVYGIWAEE